jgi:hypothetical protein
MMEMLFFPPHIQQVNEEFGAKSSDGKCWSN